ncbi:MAG: hypothetical protein JW914_01075 [Syntrophaceae bacterium]|nr:hypothetical protein [Syntrophaceae bacterium]
MRNYINILFCVILLISGCATSQTAGDSSAPSGGKGEYKGISYISGGIGLDERERLTSIGKNYSLKLVFAVKSREYLADVRVKIMDKSGKKVLDVVSEGPWFYADLPTGKYTVSASLSGREKQSAANIVKGQAQTTLRFYWD